ncbi:BMP family ABC transporter substrate-binding protein, partial [Clostridium saudiense]|nr:BMP family ABC transporter substrate-binding protein [Clostridium saudiense]
MKKRAIALALSALMLTGLVGCGSKSEGGDTADGMKVGMVTDAGTIDDKSFNQGTWEGIAKAEAEFGVDRNYIRPSGETEADYLKEIQNLYDT